MRHLLTLVVLFSFTVPYTWAAPESFIGREIPPSPVDCADKGGGILNPDYKYKNVLDRDYVYADHNLLCNGYEIVLLKRFVEYREKKPYWNVIDELRLPLLKYGRTVLERGFCQSSQYAESEIFAVGIWGPTREDNSSVAKKISHAWRFNLKEGKIQPIPTTSITCKRENHH